MKIGFCVEELALLSAAERGGYVSDGAYALQADIARGLLARGNAVTFLGTAGRPETAAGHDLSTRSAARTTWSQSPAYDLAGRAAWRVQRALGLPYLNVFTNGRVLDASLRVLPGHDVAFERNALYSGGVALACRRLRLPYVLFFDADQFTELDYLGRPIRGLLRHHAEALLRVNLACAATVICVSEVAHTALTQRWGVPPGRVVVLPNAVDVESFRPDPVARARVRAELRLDDDPVTMFVGSFFKWHDTTTLVDAFAELVRVVPRAKLVFVGDGEGREPTERLAERLGVAGAVRFLGTVRRTEVPALLAAADVAVVAHPALGSPPWFSPLKLFEYMACGAAVVATSGGQVDAILQDGVSGLLVPAGSSSALAAALRRLCLDEALRSALGRTAREQAVRHFSREQYMDVLESVLREASLHGHGRQGGPRRAGRP